MKKGGTILKRILIGLVALVALAMIGVYFYLQSFHPTYKGTLTLEGLQEEVEVYFDDYGIPHIYAQNEEDAYFALGYVHAQERLFQMEMLRRVGGGRLAEILGEDLAETDQFFRTIGINEMAKNSAKEFLSERTQPYQKAVFAYLDGLNTFVNTGKAPLEYTLLGIEKAEFTPEDIYCIAGYMGFSFNHAFENEPILTKIQNKLGEDYLKDFAIDLKEGIATIPSYPNEKKGVAQERETISNAIGQIFEKLPVPIWSGSNSWVVSGEKTKSGKVFLANDAHIGYGQPSVWYEAHLEYPGFSFYGNFVAGMPFGTIGHTRNHAWGITMLENDDTDLYQEKYNPDNPNQVQFKDTWEDVKTRHEVVKVKGGEDLEFDVKITRHGPIINDCVEDIEQMTDQPISVSMTLAKFSSPVFKAFYDLSHAENMQDFQAALATMTAPGFNVMYGDQAGNIAWWATARLTKYPEHVNGKFILNGYDGNDESLGYYDFSENPHSINPPSNFVYSANNQPDTALGVLHQGYYLPEYRAKRIIGLLEKEDQWDLEKMKEMITDDVSSKYPEVAKTIVSVLESSDTELTDNQQEAISQLKAWKGEHELTSLAPTIYYKLIYHVLSEAMTDEIGEEDFQSALNLFVTLQTIPFLVENDASIWWDDVNTDEKETRQAIFTRAFEKAIAALESELGKNPQKWEWQKVHQITHKHAFGQEGGPLGAYFNVGAIPINGGHEVINNVSFDLSGEDQHTILFGPSKRILIDFDDVENAHSVLPTGQSGVVASKHYDDQAQMYANGEFRKMMMNEEEIKKSGRKLMLKKK